MLPPDSRLDTCPFHQVPTPTIFPITVYVYFIIILSQLILPLNLYFIHLLFTSSVPNINHNYIYPFVTTSKFHSNISSHLSQTHCPINFLISHPLFPLFNHSIMSSSSVQFHYPIPNINVNIIAPIHY